MDLYHKINGKIDRNILFEHINKKVNVQANSEIKFCE